MLGNGDRTPWGPVTGLEHDGELPLLRFTVGDRTVERGFDAVVSRRVD